MRAILDHTEDVAANTRTFWFKPEQAVRYVAGQFTELHLPHDSPDNRRVKRWFTLSSSPSEPLLAITTKFAGVGASTFKQTLFSLKPGTEVSLAEPMGDFVLPKDASIPLVFVAAGIGITPVRSMVKWLRDTGEQREIHLIYAVHNPEEFAFEPLFTAYGLTFRQLITAPSPSWHGETGRLSAQRILGFIDNRGAPLIYLSGPEKLVERLNFDLQHAGIEKSRLVADFFHGYSRI